VDGGGGDRQTNGLGDIEGARYWRGSGRGLRGLHGVSLLLRLDKGEPSESVAKGTAHCLHGLLIGMALRLAFGVQLRVLPAESSEIAFETDTPTLQCTSLRPQNLAVLFSTRKLPLKLR